MKFCHDGNKPAKDDHRERYMVEDPYQSHRRLTPERTPDREGCNMDACAAKKSGTAEKVFFVSLFPD